jgi:hypothetical protein
MSAVRCGKMAFDCVSLFAPMSLSNERVQEMASFSLGQVVASQGAIRHLTESELSAILRRHAAGDWGDVPEEQRTRNNLSLQNGRPVFSVYSLGPGKIILVQTDGERASSFVQIKDEQDDEGSPWNRFANIFADKLFLRVAGTLCTLLAGLFGSSPNAVKATTYAPNDHCKRESDNCRSRPHYLKQIYS